MYNFTWYLIFNTSSDLFLSSSVNSNFEVYVNNYVNLMDRLSFSLSRTHTNTYVTDIYLDFYLFISYVCRVEFIFMKISSSLLSFGLLMVGWNFIDISFQTVQSYITVPRSSITNPESELWCLGNQS